MITTLFEYASFLQEQKARKGLHTNHVALLDEAAELLVAGYANLKDANEEVLTRYDAWGNEIGFTARSDAVHYLQNKERANADPRRKSFLVQVPGYWGRGATVKEAAENCKKAGARRMDYTIVDLVLGDDKPAITNNGMNIEHAAGAQVIRIATSIRLGVLLHLDTET